LKGAQYKYEEHNASGNLGHVNATIDVYGRDSVLKSLKYGNGGHSDFFKFEHDGLSPATLRTLACIFDDLADEAERLSTLLAKARLLS
jgi:hypothetical protein